MAFLDWYNAVFLVLFALAAFLYASVGHGGASAYLALMSFYGLAPAEAKPLVLMMNVLVSSVALFSFYRKQYFDGRMFLYLALPSVPMAFVGSIMPLSDFLYRQLLGIILIASALKLLIDQRPQETIKPYNPWVLMGIGFCLGWVSGLLGVGGGILLSPLLMFLAWAPAKTISGLSAAFILVNSLSGLVALQGRMPVLANTQFAWIGIVFIFGWMGAQVGVQRANFIWIKRLLAVVLIVASFKLFLQ
jgi:uncharacterized membrane protein YfcA